MLLPAARSAPIRKALGLALCGAAGLIAFNTNAAQAASSTVTFSFSTTTQNVPLDFGPNYNGGPITPPATTTTTTFNPTGVTVSDKTGIFSDATSFTPFSLTTTALSPQTIPNCADYASINCYQTPLSLAITPTTINTASGSIPLTFAPPAGASATGTTFQASPVNWQRLLITDGIPVSTVYNGVSYTGNVYFSAYSSYTNPTGPSPYNIGGYDIVISLDEAGPAPVPSPVPAMGAMAAYGWSRRLRQRIRSQALPA